MIDAILIAIANYILGLVNLIQGYIQNLLNQVATIAANIFSAIQAFLNQVVSAVVITLQNVIAQVGSTLATILNSISAFFQNMLTAFLNATVAVVQAVGTFITNLITQVRTFIQNAVNSVVTFIQSAAAQLQALIQTAANAIAAFLNGLVGQVQTAVGTVIASVQQLYTQTVATIQQSFDVLFQGATAIIATVNERIGDLRAAFLESAAQLVASLLQLSEEQLAPVRDSIAEYVTPWVELMDPADLATIAGAVNTIASPNTLSLKNRVDAYQLVRLLTPTSRLGRFTWNCIFGLGMVLFVYQGIAQANSAVILQEFSRVYSWMILSPPEIASAYRRGALTKEEALEIIQRHGYPLPQATRLLDNAALVPAPADLTAMWHRGLINREQLDKALFQNGLDPEWSGRVVQASEIIPPVQDLISMAVKEVFSPEIAARFGQFEDFPEAFQVWAQKQGLTKEWAINYWAAHWSLPSPQMGFEMLHRGIIEDGDLNLLLRSLDIMPYWREKLKEMSFVPFTRVDIRRMNAMGFLDETGVVRAYRDLGYDLERATLMKDFTVALNATGDPDNPEDLGKLTRASILNFYGDGLLTREAAMALLVEGGATPAAAALHTASVDYDKEARERKAEADLVIALADAGTITVEEAQDRLNSLGMSDEEVNRAVAAIIRNLSKRTALPSKAEGKRWVQAGLIEPEDYQDLLIRLGYSDRWVAVYMADIPTPEAPNA